MPIMVHIWILTWVINANSLSADLLRPDLNIYIDISPEESMKRLNKGRATIELYESIENLKKVKEKYFEAFELLGGQEKISVIDGNRSEKEISNDIWNEVSKLVGSDSPHLENTIQ